MYWSGAFLLLYVYTKLESIRASFLHEPSKLKWLSWESICGLKDEGGLFIRRIKDMNKACLMKFLQWIHSKQRQLLDSLDAKSDI